MLLLFNIPVPITTPLHFAMFDGDLLPPAAICAGLKLAPCENLITSPTITSKKKHQISYMEIIYILWHAYHQQELCKKPTSFESVTWDSWRMHYSSVVDTPMGLNFPADWFKTSPKTTGEPPMERKKYANNCGGCNPTSKSIPRKT